MPGTASAVTTYDSGTCGTSATWVLDSDGTLTISGTGTIDDSSGYSNWSSFIKAIVINSEITEIGAQAFTSCTSAQSVYIPASVTTIGDGAFGSCSLLAHIFYEGSSEVAGAITIGENNFDTSTWHCEAPVGTALTYTEKCVATAIECPYCGTSYMGKTNSHNYVDGICSECGVSEDWSHSILPDNTISIGGYNGTDTEITIPSEIDGVAVTSIAMYAFANNQTITSVIIPDSVTSIGALAFSGSSLTKVIMGKNVQTIETQAFANSPITEITLGESLTTLGILAFQGCPFESIHLPASLTNMDIRAISHCPSLAEVTVDSGNPIYSVGSDGCLYENGTTLAWAPRDLTGTFDVPSSVTAIGSFAFYGCKTLTAVNIPETVTEIGMNAFYRAPLKTIVFGLGEDFCSKLSSENRRNTGCISRFSERKVGAKRPAKTKQKFLEVPYSCESLESICIPTGVTEIGSATFMYCSSLKTVTVPKNVTTMDECPFAFCSGLETIYFMNPETVFADNTFGYGGNLINGLVIYGYAGSTAQTHAENNSITFVLLDDAPVIVPALTDTEYEAESDVSFTVYSSGELSDLQEVKMDGETVDPSNYTLEEGSTIVKFKSEYMDTLAGGNHTITLVYSGASVATTVSVTGTTCDHIYDNAVTPLAISAE